MPLLDLIAPHPRDLGGGFVVRRALPSAQRQAVGPFLFFDHFGPVTVRPEDNFDVRPHPHVGLATVTYLFEGAIMHRDSLGVVQRIEPGAINLMTAGRGIVHSERAPDDLRQVAHVNHGLQLWVALPAEAEDCDPAFAHTPADALPRHHGQGFVGRVMIGSQWGLTSPVTPASPTLYYDIEAEAGAVVDLPADGHERAIYPVHGSVVVGGIDGDASKVVPEGVLGVLDPTQHARLATPAGAHFVVIGGEPLGHRHLQWNFVATTRERLAAAMDAWRKGQFPAVPGENEFIPAPGG